MKKRLLTLLLVALMAFAAAPTAFAESVSYSNASEWAKQELNAANKLGLIPQSAAADMQKPVTRAEFAEIAMHTYKALGGSVPSFIPPLDTFSDTDNTYVLRAYGLGIVRGLGNGTFGPSQSSNREQIATMLGRMLECFIQVDAATTDMSINIPDKGNISDWALLYVCKLYEMGIVKGDQNGNFLPHDTTTREQAVVMAYRLYFDVLR